MLNLLRMDLYRLIRSKCVYVCLGLLLGMAVLCFGMVWMFGTPAGQEFASEIGMYDSVVVTEGGIVLDEYDTLAMLREISMDGGGYSCVLGIVTVLFVCMDFNSGYIKNIMSLHRSRWKYVGSKVLAAGILNLFYLTAQFGLCMLLNLLFQNLVSFTGLPDSVFYLSWVWLLTTAMTTSLIFICAFTRSVSAGIISALLLGSGILLMIVSRITSLFGASGWMEYTLYYNITYGPSSYRSLRDLTVYAIGLLFLAVYAAAGAAVLSRKDI